MNHPKLELKFTIHNYLPIAIANKTIFTKMPEQHSTTWLLGSSSSSSSTSNLLNSSTDIPFKTKNKIEEFDVSNLSTHLVDLRKILIKKNK